MNHTDSAPSPTMTPPARQSAAPVASFRDRVRFALANVRPMTEGQRAIVFCDTGRPESSGGTDHAPSDPGER